MMIRKLMLAIAATAMTLLGSSVYAEQNIKVAVVDVQKVLQQSPEIATVNQQLKKQFQGREQEIIKIDQSLQALAKKLERDGAVMSADEREKLSADVAQERRRLYRLQQDFHDDLADAEHQATQKLLDKVQKNIAEIAKKEGYDLVLQKNGVPFANDKVDITDKILSTMKG